MQVGPYTESNKHQTPANGTRLCQNLSASVQVVERARDRGASRVSRLGWSYPDTIGARRSALSVWILPALTTSPARPVDDGGSCKNRSCGVYFLLVGLLQFAALYTGCRTL